MDVNGMSLPQIIDNVEIFNASDLWVLGGSFFKHVVSSNHEVHVSRQTEERSVSLDCNFFIRHFSKINKGYFQLQLFIFLRLVTVRRLFLFPPTSFMMTSFDFIGGIVVSTCFDILGHTEAMLHNIFSFIVVKANKINKFNACRQRLPEMDQNINSFS